MKKITLIIVALVLILSLLGLWVYSMMYGSPQKAEEIFGNFGFGNNGEVTEFPTDTDWEFNDAFLINVTEDVLRQLTFKPVIGFRHLERPTTPAVRFVEAGTGHVFDIDITTGNETRVSPITVTNAHSAVVSHDGTLIAIRQGYTAVSPVVLIDVTGEARQVRSFTDIIDFDFASSREFRFTTETDTGLDARVYAVDSGATRTLFTIPFYAATIRWSDTGSAHTVYTKPAAQLLGYAYTVTAGSIRRLPFNGRGLLALANDDFVVYSRFEDSAVKSYVYTTATGNSVSSPITPVPEKCVFSKLDRATLVCGYQLTDLGANFPDDWYKGVRTFRDSIWAIDLEGQSATQLITPHTTIGRELDMRDLHLSPNERQLYFINNTDKTLWSYDI